VDATPGRGECALRFEVSDTGIGIPAQQMPRLFQPFEQLGDTTQRAGGTGLGLAISRELVRSMGGDIAVDSVAGRGSRFSFELHMPVVQAEEADAPLRRTITGYRGPRRSVLVVDDVPANRSLVADYLRPMGFIVDEAGDGQAGLESARHLAPDLILMDNVMPGMNGLEAMLRLREEPQLRAIPIVAVSASASSIERERSFAAGADAFLRKPIDLDELLRHMAALLQISWIEDGS
jgi:CheY-like chemotaxis protein